MESTYPRVLKGTPAYMPPEALQNDCSAKWDVWSFGVVNHYLSWWFLEEIDGRIK